MLIFINKRLQISLKNHIFIIFGILLKHVNYCIVILTKNRNKTCLFIVIFVCILFEAQLATDELEYIHMQHPSLEHRTPRAADRIYENASAGRSGSHRQSDDDSAQSRSNERLYRMSSSDRRHRTTSSRSEDPPEPPSDITRIPSPHYAVPYTRTSQPPPPPPQRVGVANAALPMQDEYGFVMGQNPVATFI